MMETVIIRLVDHGTAETVARALEDFRGRVVTISMKEVPAKQPKLRSHLVSPHRHPAKKKGLPMKDKPLKNLAALRWHVSNSLPGTDSRDEGGLGRSSTTCLS
jgi:hypothetical protein